MVLLVLAAVAVGTSFEQQRKFTDLYFNELAPEEVPLLSLTLAEAGIEHRVSTTKRAIHVLEEDRVQAKIALIEAGMPRAVGRFAESLVAPPSRETAVERAERGKTAAEQRAHRIRAAEEEMSAVIRGLPQVLDASAKFIQPDKCCWPPRGPERGRLFFKFEPGGKLNKTEMRAIQVNTALSCPDLKLERFSFIDSSGKNLLATPEERPPDG